MGKAKHSKISSTKHKTRPVSKPVNNGIKRRQHSNSNVKHSSAKNTSRPHGITKKARIPFSSHDRVLLVGEGDFSFTLSLLRNHATKQIISTSFDDYNTLQQKYPDVDSTLTQLRNPVESTEPSDDDRWNGFSDNEANALRLDPCSEPQEANEVIVLHGIDATSLSKAHRKTLSPYTPFTKIVFNFPHTGGLSTDVNRQVRANQELLVRFFNSAKPLLATNARPAKLARNDSTAEQYDEGNDPNFDVEEEFSTALSTGHILVTLFEGEPYTLWNIRDLARHCGLQVIESFKFPWSAYPGYKHARTIGDITKGQDRDDGKRKGAWRGEERDARTYVIALKDEVASTGGRKKRKRGAESDDSD